MKSPYLREVQIKPGPVEEFPFYIPSIAKIARIKFSQPITFIVGENGAGKSTLMEAIAVAMGLNAEGGTKHSTFSTKETHSALYKYIKTVKGPYRPTDWYFLRAESFYNVASLMDKVDYLHSYGGKSLHAQSHGESFMSVLAHKLKGNGFYLFDEPEAALSPSRQMSALVEMDRLVKNGSQLIIATHSPILMAYPNSTIYVLSENGLVKSNYEDTEHYQVTRDFLNKKELMLRNLLKD